ncbi:MAG: carbohydrate binding family 9 domain-containing protein [Acidobacteria bacterium]|jgi:hypothetical protein|nr:carbohydrate binding family 9 domain-containing protein [Acidobacteriota bacterium]
MPRCRKKDLLLLLLLIGCCAPAAFAAEDGPIIAIKAGEPIMIDGALDEAVWRQAPISREFITFHPLVGRPLGLATDIWVAYSGKTLYFAFKCHDNRPGEIKTSIAKRDNCSKDDWIGVILDPLDNRQSSVEFYVNPNGCQTDGLTSAVDGVNFDPSPDYVWESAGRIAADGYTVEMAIPLESLRYKSGEQVRMGVVFMRHAARLGAMSAWPELKAGESQFNAMTGIEYRDLRKGLMLEVLPNFTVNRDRARASDGAWGRGETDPLLGVSLKYGITSSLTAEATIRPDFSQVESDAFQVEVNQRYPIFYVEKRPFFMEGTNAIDFGLVAGGMMSAAVYSRSIADPEWAAKVSGTAGKNLFAVLAADERLPEPAGGSGHALWGVARVKRSLGSDNSIGMLYSGRYAGEDKNSVLGADLQYRFFGKLRLTASGLFSSTQLAGSEKADSGFGLNAMLLYGVPTLDASLAYERYSGDFAMASSFLMRRDFEQLQFFLGPNLTPRAGQFAGWVKRVQPYLRGSLIHDLGTRMDDRLLKTGVNVYTRWSGTLKLEYRQGREAWNGVSFRRNAACMQASLRPWSWLSLGASANFGDRIYYDPLAPFAGRGRTLSFAATVQPGVRSNLGLELLYDALERRPADGGGRVYALNIANLTAAYQFNRFFLVRGALRYNDYERNLATDLLASFTLIPGTVVHLGYGSLYEEGAWRKETWQPGNDRLLNMKNSLFFKVSYLWRVH